MTALHSGNIRNIVCSPDRQSARSKSERDSIVDVVFDEMGPFVVPVYGQKVYPDNES